MGRGQFYLPSAGVGEVDGEEEVLPPVCRGGGGRWRGGGVLLELLHQSTVRRALHLVLWQPVLDRRQHIL